MSNACEQANGRASGPVLQSVFLVVLAHSAVFVVRNPMETRLMLSPSSSGASVTVSCIIINISYIYRLSFGFAFLFRGHVSM